MLQLNPPLPIETKAFGKGHAHVLLDYGPESDLYWVCFFDESRICVAVSNEDIRIQRNYTLGRVPDRVDAGKTILVKAAKAL